MHVISLSSDLCARHECRLQPTSIYFIWDARCIQFEWIKAYWWTQQMHYITSVLFTYIAIIKFRLLAHFVAPFIRLYCEKCTVDVLLERTTINETPTKNAFDSGIVWHELDSLHENDGKFEWMWYTHTFTILIRLTECSLLHLLCRISLHGSLFVWKRESFLKQ